MEPLTTAAITVASLVLKKTFEKTGDKLGEAFSNQIGGAIQLFKKKPLEKTKEIIQANPSANFQQAVLELEILAKTDDEISQAILATEKAVKADPELLQKIHTIAKAIKDEPILIQNNSKLAEKIGLVVWGGNVNVQNLNV